MYILIVNTFSANGKGLKILKTLEEHPLFKKSYCRSFKTEYEGHAEKIAQQVAEIHKEQINCFIVIGGDGTLHEVINGLKHFSSLPIGFIPAGTGNDFARGCGLAGDPVDVFKAILAGRRQRDYWPGDYLTDDRSRKYGRQFVNNIGIGLEADVVEAVNNSKYKKVFTRLRLNSLTYSFAFLTVLKSFKPLTIRLEIDGRVKRMDNVWMLTVSNHPYYGGGMKINPQAKVQPNIFSVLIVENISRWKVLLLFLTVFWGKHIKMKEVSHYYASSLKVDSETAISFQADGQNGKCKACDISKETERRKIFGVFTKLSS
ncbi:diacylglycerol/lipid kinase family protein [Sediminibacillus albus]|uniref:Lipid kinase, YegS/Rv2252/BmrU family n=1 Tax=Sediminibacillus albus TaxID=407036 RepID=A0A1G9BYT5_9BACI|nr:diacylglycerol kinase family protein [Sediminibacillus albus]SDK44570.1 lipid kinase, YegS/Rv2252/BmrU family [Sediminibacillus albus]